MGSRSKIDLAYIAGFLDGDGSLMLQIKKRKDGNLKWRFMATICFYQDSRHEKPLLWIKNILKIGYVSRRSDGITELRVNGYHQIKEILQILLPFLRFKKEQAKAILSSVNILCETNCKSLPKAKLKQLVKYIMTVQNNNYVARRKKTEQEMLSILGLTP